MRSSARSPRTVSDRPHRAEGRRADSGRPTAVRRSRSTSHPHDDAPDTTPSQQPSPPPASSEDRYTVARSFISGVTSGDAQATWDRYTSSTLRGSDERSRFIAEFSGRGYDLIDVVSQGDDVVVRLSREEGQGIHNIVRVSLRVVDEDGPKIAGFRVNP